MYDHIEVKKACAHRYFTGLKSLSSTACYNLDRWFPQDEQALYDVGAAVKLATNHVEVRKHDHMQRRISTEADVFFSDVVSRLDVKINLDIEPDGEPKTAELSQEILDIEMFLEKSEISCLRVRTSQSR